ncbi:hypothetical protein R5M92_04175 [Halomonas sp. Bachu 37]|uniref:hypothetical protein n=1 Tax=Halomonas kashgarensis TaxID=3084920 RepID=UPI003216FD39
MARDLQGAAHDVLSRLCRNYESGKGICLNAYELHALSVTQVGDLWAQEDPRDDEGEG